MKNSANRTIEIRFAIPEILVSPKAPATSDSTKKIIA